MTPNNVVHATRAFLRLLMKAREGHIINTSSVNGFWASIGPARPHTAYCAAKFAVKGFTEALMTDLAVNAPHIKCSVVMPGHVGTEIVAHAAPQGTTTSTTSAATTEMIGAIINTARSALIGIMSSLSRSFKPSASG